MVSDEYEFKIIQSGEPADIEKEYKDFLKDHYIKAWQYHPLVTDDGGILYTVALCYKSKPMEGCVEDMPFIPKEERPGSNEGPIWMDCPKCKKPCLPYEYDMCRCGHEFTREDRKLFKELLAANGGQKKVKKDGKTKVDTISGRNNIPKV